MAWVAKEARSQTKKRDLRERLEPTSGSVDCCCFYSYSINSTFCFKIKTFTAIHQNRFIMKIICAGLSKTGSKSLAAALKILGFTVHDFDEHVVFHRDEYIQASEGKMPDFAGMYKNVDAVIGQPVYFFWKEIKESCPSAKVILAVRDNVETWVDSMLMNQDVWESTMQTQLWTRIGMVITPTGRKWTKIIRPFNKFFLTHDQDENKMSKLAQLYLEHNSRVKASIPRDELLVYNVKQGWNPLCKFLGVDVPDVPFPRLNVKCAGIPNMINQSMVGKKVFNEVVVIVSVAVLMVAIFLFLLIKSGS